MRLCYTLLAIFIFIADSSSQCVDPTWLQPDGLRGFDGTVRATILWDRDGAGGEPPVLVAAGNFTIAGTTFARSIALWNGQSWEPLASGVGGEVHSLAVLPNGDLIAGGSFREAGGVVVNHLGRWNGNAWSSFGTGMAGLGTPQVSALTVLPNGDMVAGGFFRTAGGTEAVGIARWDGTAWHALGRGLGGASAVDPANVTALLALPGGGLVAGGSFRTADGLPAPNIARWNGAEWFAIGVTTDPRFHESTRTLALLPNGDLVAGGIGVHRWDGVSWSVMGSVLDNKSYLIDGVWSLAILPNGDLVAGGAFWTGTGGPANFVARWDGTAWVPLGSGTQNFVNTLTVLPNGDLVAAGSFVAAGSVHASHIARWDGNAWNPYGSGIGPVNSSTSFVGVNVYALTRMPNGDIVAGGSFAGAGNVSAHNIARWDGSKWFPLGLGTSGEVRALAVAPNGDLIVGGAFRKAGGVTNNCIARWDGEEWSSIGTGVDGLVAPVVYSLAVLPDGQIIAGGSFMTASGVPALRIARWTGSEWLPLGTGMNGNVMALALLPGGELIAGGEFKMAGGSSANGVARWDGTAWSPLGAGVNNGVFSIARLLNGNLVVGGRFNQTGASVVSGPLATWDGGNWSAFTPRPAATVVNGLTVLPNGNLIVGINNGAGVLVWDGNAWSGLGSGTGNTSIGVNAVNALASLPDGGFVMGGSFIHVAGVVSPFFAHWGCPLSTANERPVLTNASAGGGGVRFAVQGTPGKNYSIHYSADLVNWQAVQNGLANGATFEDSDPIRKAAARGFYRAAQE